MPYNESDFKTTNVNYLNKDFVSLKRNLINYAKTYFENSYRDFNETSPGMMLIEMSAYVGDVLSFYIDQQYREMLLPLAEEKRNVTNIAKMLGYKVKPIIPAFVDLTVKQTVDANTDDINNIVPDFTQAAIVDKGMKITSVTDSSIVYETLDYVDFTVSGSGQDWRTADTEVDSNGLINKFILERKIKAISGETKSYSFSISGPTKFLELKLPQTNVIDILSVYDSNSNRWYEVEYLAQDRIPRERYYHGDLDRTHNGSDGNPYNTSYLDLAGNVMEIPVQYTLDYIKTTKRFITQLNDDNTISLVFGNGLIRNGQALETAFYQTEQAGITVPGQITDLASAVDPLLGDEYHSLGEAPAHTTLTVNYRIGGGITANVSAADLTTIDTISTINGAATTNISVSNSSPARGGSDEQSVDEIRERAGAHFATQNRCVTRSDYEARLFSMPAKFGNVAKAYVDRTSPEEQFLRVAQLRENASDMPIYLYECSNTDGIYNTLTACLESDCELDEGICQISPDLAAIDYEEFQALISGIIPPDLYTGGERDTIPTINIYTLSYDINKNLVETPGLTNDLELAGVPQQDTGLVAQNIRNYLNEFRIITDGIELKSGYIINFGVFFDIVAQRYSNVKEVKLKCIQKITDYFAIDRMQFRQPINVSQLEYELMGIDGVRAVNYVRITQHVDVDKDGNGSGQVLDIPTWYKQIDPTVDSGMSNNTEFPGSDIYGWFYDFQSAYDKGLILPAADPAIFELKNPTQNIKGKVR